MKEEKRRITDEPLEPLIHRLRSQRVILDADLARLYGVTTKSLNQAIKRNAERFPLDFAFQLTIAEATEYKSLSTRPVAEGHDSTGKKMNRSQIVTSSQRHRDPRSPPWAFSEHGALMAAKHDSALRELYRKLQPLLAPPPNPPKPRIGF